MATLNLDALVKNARTITLGGKEHEVIDMTVEDFIETSKAIESLDKDAPATMHVQRSVEMILRRVPTLTEKDLKRLSLEKLSVILKFIQGEMDDEKEPAQEQGGQEEEKK